LHARDAKQQWQQGNSSNFATAAAAAAAPQYPPAVEGEREQQKQQLCNSRSDVAVTEKLQLISLSLKMLQLNPLYGHGRCADAARMPMMPMRPRQGRITAGSLTLLLLQERERDKG